MAPPDPSKAQKTSLDEEVSIKKKGIRILPGALSVDPMKRKDSTKDVTAVIDDKNPHFMLDSSGKRVVNMDYIIKTYITSAEAQQARLNEKRELKPLFESLNPASSLYEALPSSNTCSLGFMNFKRAKLVAPLDGFLYKKYTKIPTIVANKKAFE
jgi:hypothetical protein